MDWGELGEHEIDAKRQKLYVFVMVLGYSRMSFSDFLNSLLLEEIESKEKLNLGRRVKNSKLPFYKKIENFDLKFQTSICESRVKEVMTCRFI
jgi:hypothetical protein